MKLTTQSLSIGYSAQAPLLNDLILELKPKQLTCLVGANGKGKTTLIQTLSGMQAPLNGGVYYDQGKLDKLTLAERSKCVSIVLSQKMIPANLSVREVVELGRLPYTKWFGSLSSKDSNIVDHAMQATEVLQFANRKLHELSDGEKQRVMIAKALAQDTPIMILDEPTAHLDVQHRVSLILLLKKLSRETGKSILLSTHELEVAIQLADKIWLIDDESQFSVGMPEDLVLGGAFDQLFDTNQIVFNSNEGRFDVQSNADRYYTLTGGSNLTRLWTQKALLKEGFLVQTDGKEAEFEVTCDGEIWKVFQNGQVSGDLRTIEELVGYLSVEI